MLDETNQDRYQPTPEETQKAEDYLTDEDKRSSQFRENARSIYPHVSHGATQKLENEIKRSGNSERRKENEVEHHWDAYVEDPDYDPYRKTTNCDWEKSYYLRRLKVAEWKGERIVEIPIRLEFTVKVPESLIIDEDKDKKNNPLGIAYSVALDEVLRGGQRNFRNKIKQIDPEAVADSQAYNLAIHRLNRMLDWKPVFDNNEDPNHREVRYYKSDEYVPSLSIDEKKARELYAQVKAISQKYDLDYEIREKIKDEGESELSKIRQKFLKLGIDLEQ